ncbi:hypothetical protein Tco_1303800 [Tanacetum coccineum]
MSGWGIRSGKGGILVWQRGVVCERRAYIEGADETGTHGCNVSETLYQHVECVESVVRMVYGLGVEWTGVFVLSGDEAASLGVGVECSRIEGRGGIRRRWQQDRGSKSGGTDVWKRLGGGLDGARESRVYSLIGCWKGLVDMRSDLILEEMTHTSDVGEEIGGACSDSDCCIRQEVVYLWRVSDWSDFGTGGDGDMMCGHLVGAFGNSTLDLRVRRKWRWGRVAMVLELDLEEGVQREG